MCIISYEDHLYYIFEETFLHSHVFRALRVEAAVFHLHVCQSGVVVWEDIGQVHLKEKNNMLEFMSWKDF